MNLTPSVVKLTATRKEGVIGSISFKNTTQLHAGQVFKIGTFGIGETSAWITDWEDDIATVSFLENNSVTHKIMLLPIGECITIRGPFGNGFSLGEKGYKEILLVSKDDGILSQKKLINDLIQEGLNVTLLHFTSSPKNLIMKSSLEKACNKEASPINGIIVDMTKKGPQDLDSFIAKQFKKHNIANIDGVALSGNEDFQKAVCKTLEKTNIKDKSIQILFNRNFTSGMGWSNQDLYGATNVWKDGPVFTLSEVRRFPGIFI